MASQGVITAEDLMFGIQYVKQEDATWQCIETGAHSECPHSDLEFIKIFKSEQSKLTVIRAIPNYDTRTFDYEFYYDTNAEEQIAQAILYIKNKKALNKIHTSITSYDFTACESKYGRSDSRSDGRSDGMTDDSFYEEQFF